jgi:8-oxo-dGTP diphosphatase
MKITSRNSIPILDVAVGIIIRHDDRILMARRPDGTPWAGYWEFPGGKIETGETPNETLFRELHEEIGIEVITAYPWITREYDYPDRRVRLHLYRVFKWTGNPVGKEGQQLSWEDPHDVQLDPLLPANDQLLQDLCLPSLYAITQASKLGIETFITRLHSALEKGIRLIQVREQMDKEQLIHFTSEIVSLAHPYNAQVLVNGDAALAHSCHANGVHFQSRQLMQCTQRPDVALWAASCHNREELIQAAKLGVDFVVLSPVLPTQSHPGEPALGWEKFNALALDLPMPVYALGGMQTDLLETAMTHNAHGIAMLSGVW